MLFFWNLDPLLMMWSCLRNLMSLKSSLFLSSPLFPLWENIFTAKKRSVSFLADPKQPLFRTLKSQAVWTSAALKASRWVRLEFNPWVWSWVWAWLEFYCLFSPLFQSRSFVRFFSLSRQNFRRDGQVTLWERFGISWLWQWGIISNFSYICSMLKYRGNQGRNVKS